MRAPRSIRWLLLGWYGLTLAVILSGLGVVAYRAQRDRETRQIDSDLQERVGILARSIRPDHSFYPAPAESPPAREKSLQLAPESEPFFEKDSGYYYAVWLKNGPALEVSPAAPPDIPPPPANSSGARNRDGLREMFQAGAPGDVFLAGYSIQEHEAKLQRFAFLLLLLGLVIFSVSMLGGWWIIHAALQPLLAITQAADQIAKGDLSQRIDTRETGSELDELAKVLNSTFCRLEDAFAQQRRFTADAAHELRTPVTVMLTHAQNGLSLPENNEEQQEAFSACQRAAQRMRTLVESLLQLSRLQSGREAMKLIPCHLDLIASEAAEMLRPLAQSQGMNLVLDLKPAELRGDPDRFDQVLTNLIGNAIQYGKENGSIRISTRSEKDAVVCVVQDNGPGISPQHLPHIFDRFYRVDKARTGPRSGQTGRTGLGLAICKAIVEAHGGSIVAESVPGKGTTFSVRLQKL